MLAFVRVDELLLFIIFPLPFPIDVEWSSNVDMCVEVEPGAFGRSPIVRMPRIGNEKILFILSCCIWLWVGDE